MFRFQIGVKEMKWECGFLDMQSDVRISDWVTNKPSRNCIFKHKKVVLKIGKVVYQNQMFLNRGGHNLESEIKTTHGNNEIVAISQLHIEASASTVSKYICHFWQKNVILFLKIGAL